MITRKNVTKIHDKSLSFDYPIYLIYRYNIYIYIYIYIYYIYYIYHNYILIIYICNYRLFIHTYI